MPCCFSFSSCILSTNLTKQPTFLPSCLFLNAFPRNLNYSLQKICYQNFWMLIHTNEMLVVWTRMVLLLLEKFSKSFDWILFSDLLLQCFGQKIKWCCFRKSARWKFFYHLTACIVEYASEEISFVSKKHTRTNKKQKKLKKM